MSCFFGHEWSKWSLIENSDSRRDENSHIIFWLTQQRVCSACGKHQMKIQVERI